MRPAVTATAPLFIVADLARSTAFYCDKLGFRDPSAWGEPPCFAMMHRDEFDLMLGLATPESPVRPNGPSGMWDVYIKVGDIAAEIEALKGEGVPLAAGPRLTFYNITEIEVIDPDGHRICIGQVMG